MDRRSRDGVLLQTTLVQAGPSNVLNRAVIAQPGATPVRLLCLLLAVGGGASAAFAQPGPKSYGLQPLGEPLPIWRSADDESILGLRLTSNAPGEWDACWISRQGDVPEPSRGRLWCASKGREAVLLGESENVGNLLRYRVVRGTAFIAVIWTEESGSIHIAVRADPESQWEHRAVAIDGNAAPVEGVAFFPQDQRLLYLRYIHAPIDLPVTQPANEEDLAELTRSIMSQVHREYLVLDEVRLSSTEGAGVPTRFISGETDLRDTNSIVGFPAERGAVDVFAVTEDSQKQPPLLHYWRKSPAGGCMPRGAWQVGDYGSTLRVYAISNTDDYLLTWTDEDVLGNTGDDNEGLYWARASQPGERRVVVGQRDVRCSGTAGAFGLRGRTLNGMLIWQNESRQLVGCVLREDRWSPPQPLFLLDRGEFEVVYTDEETFTIFFTEAKRIMARQYRVHLR